MPSSLHTPLLLDIVVRMCYKMNVFCVSVGIHWIVSILPIPLRLHQMSHFWTILYNYSYIVFIIQSNSPPLTSRTTIHCWKLHISKERTSGIRLVSVWMCLRSIWNPFRKTIHRTSENVSVQCCWSGSKAVLTATLTLSWKLSDQSLWNLKTSVQKSRKPS